jgi:SAM-dependent methyltransferase
MPSATELEPAGADRRSPTIGRPSYAVRAPLVAWLKAEAEDAHRRHGDPYRVLDIGCGDKPYEPFFRPYASEYVGVDNVERPEVDLVGSIEALPVADASFDVVLCTQVLEHCADPDRAVRELRRVTARGGRVLASTHGVMVYHPSPEDLWRWTHAGLQRLFERNGEWSGVTVTPNAGTGTCLTMVIGIYVSLLAKQIHVEPVGGVVVRGLNRLGPLLDRSSARLREPGPGSMFFNYHVLAETPA